VTQYLRLASFLAFVLLGARVPFLKRPESRRRGILLVVAYVLAVNGAVGLTQRDAWPFATYPLVPSVYDAGMLASKCEYVGLDAGDREFPIHPLSFSPVFPLTLDIWMVKTYPSLTPEAKRQVGRFLLERAEEARRRLRRGEAIGSERWLGRLAAPDWWMYPRPAEVPEAEFEGLRVYLVSWRPGEREADPRRVTRVVLLEHRR
jgi:hypothetical protein